MSESETSLPASRAYSPLVLGTGVVALALLARGLEAVQQPRLFNDGPRFVKMAEYFAQGDLGTAVISDQFHPLTSALMAVVVGALPVSFEVAAQLLNVLAGGLGAWAIWSMTRDQFGDRVALAAGIVFALQPRLVASSSGVQSDGVHLGFLLAGSAVCWSALRQQAPARAAIGGGLCGLAYLTRPEGLAVAVIFAAWLAVDLLQRRTPPLRTVALGGSFALALTLVGGPYVLVLHDQTGDWTITRKKRLELSERLDTPRVRDAELRVVTASIPASVSIRDAAELSGRDPGRRTALATVTSSWSPAGEGGGPRAELGLARVLGALGEVLGDGLRALSTLGLVMILLGCVRGPPDRATRYLLGFVGLFFCVLVWLHLNSGYVSRRHWLSAVALLSPFVGRGGLRLLGWLPEMPGLRAIPRIRGLAVVAVVLAFLAHAGIPQEDADKVARRQAAQWLGARLESGVSASVLLPAEPARVVASHRARDAYFAGATRYVPLNPSPEGVIAMLDDARARGAQYVLIDSSRWDTTDPAPPWIHELHRVTYRSHEVRILALDSPP